MSCINNIISIRDVCADTQDAPPSLSGLDLMDAPEISPLNLAHIATEDYESGMELARAKLRQATLLVRNDLMSILAANHAMPNITAKTHSSGTFQPAISFPAEAKERGLTLYRNQRHASPLRKLRITNVKIYPLVAKTDAVLKIYDEHGGGMVTTYNIDLVANQANTFKLDYEVQGSFARVLLDGTDVPVAGSFLTCHTGCGGRLPNDCGYTKGWYDDRELQAKEGYGIVLEFGCACDYEQLLCDLAPTYIGEIVWLKTRVLLLEEHLRSNRLNNWVVYGREDTRTYLTDIENQYRDKWTVFINAMPGLLRQLKDSCITCNGIKWVTNI